MAKKSFVILTSVVGVTAVVAGAYAARKRRAGRTASALLAGSKPFATAVDSARQFASDWRSSDDRLTEELASVVNEEAMTAH